MKVWLAAIVGLLLCASPALAELVNCKASIEGQQRVLLYDTALPVYSSFREHYLTRAKTCPGAVVVAFMMPDLTEDQRAEFCANWDPKAKTYTFPARGERDAYGQCRRVSKACRIVNATKDQAMGIVGIGQRVAREANESGVTAVARRSGVLVLAGGQASLGSLLSSAGSGLAAALSAPAVAASVVVVGSAVYVCE
jgi:hypothetical protein